jgi:DNA-binding transcriptional regulator YhcF (GntR family)
MDQNNWKDEILDFYQKLGFTQISNILIINIGKLGISGNEYLIISVIKMFAFQKDKSFPSLAKLMNITSLSKHTIIDTLKSLEKKGFLKIIKNLNSNNSYKSNTYSLKPLLEIIKKITINSIKNENIGVVQNLHYGSAEIAPGVVQILHPNNKNINNKNTNTPLPPNFENKKCEGELISNQNLKTLNKKYSEKEVDIAYQFLKYLIKQGKEIKDPLAFLFTLLKNKTYEDITEIEIQRQQKEIEERKNKSQQYKQQEFDDYLDKKTNDTFEAMGPDEINEKINEIKKTLQCSDQLKDGFAILQLKAKIRKDLESHLINSS